MALILEKVLRRFISGSNVLAEISQILEYALLRGVVYYEETAKIIGADPAWDLIPEMVAAMAAAATNSTISASRITKVCLDFGFSNKTDWLIAELKGVGIISPRLSSPADVMHAGSPLYEMNPSVTVPLIAPVPRR